MPELQKEFGAAVKKMRTALGYSQNQFAIEAGITQAYLSRIERGLANPQLLKIMCIAKCLGVSLHELFNFSMLPTTESKLSSQEKKQRLIDSIQSLTDNTTEQLYNALLSQLRRR